MTNNFLPSVGDETLNVPLILFISKTCFTSLECLGISSGTNALKYIILQLRLDQR